jgi:hypothetical protein
MERIMAWQMFLNGSTVKLGQNDTNVTYSCFKVWHNRLEVGQCLLQFIRQPRKGISLPFKRTNACCNSIKRAWHPPTS